MIIKSLSLNDYRNYDTLNIEFDEGTNILYGDNAQGKTNILEAIYLSSTTKSHKGSNDKEIINFNKEEAHIQTVILKDGIDTKIDMHLRPSKSKIIAIDGSKIKKAADLLGILNVVFFSPEDLSIIKNGPSERRRFVDMELCQLDSFYLYNLSNYNKIINQRNKLLKDIYFNPSLKETLNIWDSQLVSYGSKIIERRISFCDQICEILKNYHSKLTGGKEDISIKYEPNVLIDEYERKLSLSQEKDISAKMTIVGPHRDDFSFIVNDIDIRKYGSQGQKKTAAISLKLSELFLLKEKINETPILLLDDVFSELDEIRQKLLIENLKEVQTIITCTGIKKNIFELLKPNKIFKVENSKILEKEIYV